MNANEEFKSLNGGQNELIERAFSYEMDRLWFGNPMEVEQRDLTFQESLWDTPESIALRAGQYWLLAWVVEESPLEFQPAPTTLAPYQVLAKFRSESAPLELALRLHPREDRWDLLQISQTPPTTISKTASAQSFVGTYFEAVEKMCAAQHPSSMDFDQEFGYLIARSIGQLTRDHMLPAELTDSHDLSSEEWALGRSLFNAFQGGRYMDSDPVVSLAVAPTGFELDDSHVTMQALVDDGPRSHFSEESLFQIQLRRIDNRWFFASTPIQID